MPRLTKEPGDAGPVTFASLFGELDVATVPDLQRALGKADADLGPVVLDLRELDFMDCAGAHLVVDGDRRLRERGRSLFVVVVDQGPIDRLLALLGLAGHLLLLNQPRQARAPDRLHANGAPGPQPASPGH